MKGESAGIDELIVIMRHLREPERGCPWDVQQTFESIAPFTIEEAYEVADAIDRRDLSALREELGDLLLQVVFHSQMAEEQGSFSFNDVVGSICDKMVRRHPHVFGNDIVVDAEAQTVAWEEHKRSERESSGSKDASALAGVARGLPEWQRALKLQHKAAKVGFDWPSPEPVIQKLHEEIEEVRAEFEAWKASPNNASVQSRLEDEIGDLLFVCANLARHAKVDVGSALRRANLKFERRFRRMEELAAGDGMQLSTLDLDVQDGYWRRVKQEE